eukprot:scaffold227875_cov31-Prasinocladus_malaysianus.AAC.1
MLDVSIVRNGMLAFISNKSTNPKHFRLGVRSYGGHSREDSLGMYMLADDSGKRKQTCSICSCGALMMTCLWAAEINIPGAHLAQEDVWIELVPGHVARAAGAEGSVLEVAHDACVAEAVAAGGAVYILQKVPADRAGQVAPRDADVA